MKNQKTILKTLLLSAISMTMAMGAWAQIAPGGISGTKLWLRADTMVTPKTDGANISSWQDVSGTGNGTMIAGTALPIYYADANGNGYPAIKFSGANNVQTTVSNTYRTVFWIGAMNMPLNNEYKRLFSWNTGAAPPIERSIYFNTSPNLYLHTGVPLTSPLVIKPYPEPTGASQPYVRFGGMEGRRQYSPRSRMYVDMITALGFFNKDDNSDIYTTINGATAYYTRPHPSGHVWGPMDGKLLLGGYFAANKTTVTNSFTGYVYEMIGIDRELTPTETKKIESYIAMKYGLQLVNSKPFTARVTNAESANSTGRDILLSDGTIIWPGESEKNLDTYHAYFNILVRDDVSDLRIFKSKPSISLNQWKSGYVTSVFTFDNNITVANGSNFDAPKRLVNKDYFVMAANAVYNRDSLISTTPYSSTKREFNGNTYQCWDRVYKMKTKGVETISMVVDALAPLENNTANKFGCSDWASKYGQNPGILVVSGTESTFVPGTLVSGKLQVNAIPVNNDANLYIVFASTLGQVKINEENTNLCTTSLPFQFTTSIAGGTWSANAPGGLYAPTVAGVDSIIYNYNGVIAKTFVAVIGTPTASVLLDHTTLYNGQKAYVEVSPSNVGFNPSYSFGIDDANYTTPSLVPVTSIDAQAVAEGGHNLMTKIKPAAVCAAEFTVISPFMRTNDIKQQPAGVEGAAIWMRGDKVKTFNGADVLEMDNLGESSIRITSMVNGDTVAAVQAANWSNGQTAIEFKSRSIFETDQIKNWKAFFMVHNFRSTSRTSLTMIYDNPTANPDFVQGASECYWFNLSGGSGYGWQTGFQKEQRVQLFANVWGLPDATASSPGTYVSVSPQYLNERGIGLPIMSTFAKRSESNYVQSVNGAAALEYTRPVDDVNMKTLDFPGRLFIGAAYKPAYISRFSKHLDGNIAEFIGFDRYLSAYEIAKIESYLAMRYGFSIRGYNADIGTNSNSDFRDYMLSDGTLAYPVASDASLQNYWEQVGFLVRDDATLLHNKLSAPISHGQQYAVSDVNPATGSVYLFNKVTPEKRGGRVIPASVIEMAVGSIFASPADIDVDKAYFALGAKDIVPVNDYAYQYVDDMIYKVAAKAVYKVRVNGIAKVSAKVATMAATPFGAGAGILQVKGTETRFTPGVLEGASLMVNDISPLNDAELMVVTEVATNPISFAPIVDARKGEAYHGAIVASATGSTSFTYQLMVGALPAGLSMVQTGLISGSPTTAGGSSTFTVRATDQQGLYKEQQFVMNVLSDIDCPPIAQPRTVIAAGKVGEMTATSIRIPEIAGYSILGVTSGSLPTGLALNSNGLLQGVPVEEGASKFVIRVKNAQGCENDVVFDVDVERSTKLHASLVNVFPNPTTGEATLTIDAELQDLLRLQIFGTNNQLVKAETYAAGTKQIRLDLSGLPTGQYFIVLTCEGKKTTLPIVVK